MKPKHHFLIGSHTSIAGGLEKAFARAESIGSTCMQIFTKSSRQWSARPLEQKNIDLFAQAAKNSSIKNIIVHAGYLINLASPDDTLYGKSIQSLTLELERCQQLNIPYLVFHPGAHLTSSKEEGIERIAHALNIILSKANGETQILLENMAGQGSTLGSTWQELADILALIKHTDSVGICFDTCHAFVAGYEFGTTQTYEQMWNDFDKSIGLKQLKVMHFNDSLKECGSHVDRHTYIGKGKLGSAAFELLCNDKRFFDIPKILETPKEEGMTEDAQAINLLKSLISKETQKELEVL